jgi:DNA-binding response OmpR family regulator
MKEPPAVETPAKTITVLSISPVEDDHNSLERILNRGEESGLTRSTWKLQPCSGLLSALPIVRQNRFSIIVSERDLSPGTWKEVLAAINELPTPPLLIVTSQLADERLWSEVLNLGGWDVLTKPFSVEEVRRVLNIAWLHWHHNADDRHDRTRTLTMAAAG